MSAAEQKVEYVDLLEKSRKADDTLAAAESKLKRMGAQFAELGNQLQGNPFRLAGGFDRQTFEEQARQLPGLLEQLRAAHNERMDLEARMSKFSWHRRTS